MREQRRASTGSQATTVFRDLRLRNERRNRVSKLLDPERKRRIERGIEAQLERWTRLK